MFKTLALISFVLFAFMAGVIFGAKKNSTNPQPRPVAIASKKAPLAMKKKTLLKPIVAKKLTNKKIELKNIKPKNSLKPKKRSGYTVVLASFATKSSAAKHVKEISRRGFDAFHYATTIKGKTWHRVGIGSFSLKSTAQGLKDELSKHKFAKGALISSLPSNNQ